VTLKLQFNVNVLFTNYTRVDKVKIVSKLDVIYFILVSYALVTFGSTSINLITSKFLELAI
jgi:hypothetical protein